MSNVTLQKNAWLVKNHDEKLTNKFEFAITNERQSYLGKLYQEDNSMKLIPCDWFCRLDDTKINQYLSKEEVSALIKNRVNQATNEQLYQIVRSFPLGYEINSGDLLKMGRIKFFVREMCAHGHKVKADSNNLFYKNDFNCQVFQPDNQDHCMTCRTCLDECNTLDNPLLTLCKCTGSIQ